MVPFGGYYMPLQYSGMGHGQSHNWTRHRASLFDVSHMVQHRLEGPGAEALLSKLTPTSFSQVKDHHSTLSCFLNPDTGGIIDDTVITRLGPQSFYIVTNAGCRDKDFAFLSDNIETVIKDGGKSIQWTVLQNRGLLALQGPLAASILGPLLVNPVEDALGSSHFGQSRFVRLRLLDGQETSPILVSRGGYTGEDGFEISITPDETEVVAETLLNTAGPEQLRLAGLGARDSLRLEAGMCLYGHDLDETTTPVEAGLSWIIGKDRRFEGGFNGSSVILQQLRTRKDGGTGVERRRVGLIVDDAPAREGAEIVDDSGSVVGKVTSGCPSPTLKKNIAMAYVKSGYHKVGTELFAVVRGKRRKAMVTKMPFVPSKYWKGGITPGI